MADFFQTIHDGLNSSSPVLRVFLTLCGVILVQIILRASIDRIVEQAVRRHHHTSLTEEHKREATLKNVFHTSTTITLWVIAAIIILVEFKVKLAPLLTGAGLVGVVAGLGAQNLIKDVLAGVFIIMENQIRVGDIVTLSTPTATVSGLVEEVTVRTTRLRDLDGNLHILTNGAIGVITNQSFEFAQVNVDIFVPYEAKLDLVESLISEAGALTAKTSSLKEDIIEPIAFLRVDQLGEAYVTVKALGKVKPGSQWAIAGDFRSHLKQLFEKHKVKQAVINPVTVTGSVKVKK